MIISWGTEAMAFGAGLLIATITTPVGVSGAVFLLPVWLATRSVRSATSPPATRPLPDRTIVALAIAAGTVGGIYGIGGGSLLGPILAAAAPRSPN